MMKCKFHCLNFSPYRLFSKKMENNNSNVDKCQCEEDTGDDLKNDNCPINTESPSTSKRNKIGLFGLCKDKKRMKKVPVPKKSPKWSIKFNCARRESKSTLQDNQNCCRCTCNQHGIENGVDEVDASANEIYNSNESGISYFRRNEPIVEENPQGARGIYSVSPATSSVPPLIITAPLSNINRIRNHEDCEEAARIARAREIEQGVEAPANFRSIKRVQLLCSDIEPDCNQMQGTAPRWLQLVCPPDLSVESLRALFQNHVTLKSCPPDSGAGCHTQVDFIHCLVPDLLAITNSSFYWGKMDRYEAERLLDGKPEGTFLLRDSAQEEFLFSVSFRKYGRSLHARIEQWNHKFSFDCHDPGVYTSDTVCGLIEHYKDPSSCMFFEPILTLPLNRKFAFSLQHLARATIVSRLTYDSINQLQLPKTLKTYLKEYHYRQKVRVEIFDDDMQWLELRNMPS